MDALLQRESIGDEASEQREAGIGQQILDLIDQVNFGQGEAPEEIEQIRALAQELISMHGEPEVGFDEVVDQPMCDNCGGANHHTEECPYSFGANPQ